LKTTFIKRVRSAAFCFVALSACSCAYKLRRGSLNRGVGDIESARVFVPIVDNLSTEVGPEAVLTGALREALSTLQGIEVVNSESDARFVLRGRVREWGRRLSSPTSLSTAEAEARGGLIRNQTTAADIKVSMIADFELLEVQSSTDSAPSVSRRLWQRQFSSEGTYEAYNRFEELSGSSSSPFINRSRERLQLRKMSDSMARQIIDQVSQDF
jgi:hypothetical protein